MIHYRALFDELVDLPLAVNSTRAVDERRMVDERIVRDDISSHRRAS
jgi:hypothetical protein